jgi:hypothetical protein
LGALEVEGIGAGCPPYMARWRPQMTQQGSSRARTGTIIALITFIGSVLGFLTLIVGPFIGIPGIPERLCVMISLCERAEVTIEVQKDPNLRADFSVTIANETVVEVSPNEGPYSLRVSSLEEGPYYYEVKAMYYGCSNAALQPPDGCHPSLASCYDAASQQYGVCEPPIEKTNEGNITVEDGAVFTVFGYNPKNIDLRRTR